MNRELAQPKMCLTQRYRKLKKFFNSRGSHPDVFLEKGVLKICSKFTEEHQ